MVFEFCGSDVSFVCMLGTKKFFYCWACERKEIENPIPLCLWYVIVGIQKIQISASLIKVSQVVGLAVVAGFWRWIYILIYVWTRAITILNSGFNVSVMASWKKNVSHQNLTFSHTFLSNIFNNKRFLTSYAHWEHDVNRKLILHSRWFEFLFNVNTNILE
jgi:hypothetical protein